MVVIFILLLVGALVCFVLSTAGVMVGRSGRPDLIALGLALWVLVPLIQQFQRL